MRLMSIGKAKRDSDAGGRRRAVDGPHADAPALPAGGTPIARRPRDGAMGRPRRFANPAPQRSACKPAPRQAFKAGDVGRFGG